MVERSKLPSPVPPSWNVLLGPSATTPPLMIKVGPNVSVLAPLPSNRIAKVVLVIVP